MGDPKRVRGPKEGGGPSEAEGSLTGPRVRTEDRLVGVGGGSSMMVKLERSTAPAMASAMESAPPPPLHARGERGVFVGGRGGRGMPCTRGGVRAEGEE